MNNFLRFIIISLFLAGIAGCASVPPDESSASIPWNQPQGWENSGFSGPKIGF